MLLRKFRICFLVLSRVFTAIVVFCCWLKVCSLSMAVNLSICLFLMWVNCDMYSGELTELDSLFTLVSRNVKIVTWCGPDFLVRYCQEMANFCLVKVSQQTVLQTNYKQEDNLKLPVLLQWNQVILCILYGVKIWYTLKDWLISAWCVHHVTLTQTANGAGKNLCAAQFMYSNS
jgi:hypothetical protein